MAISAGYVSRETFANLRRNVGMTVAAILTVAVSLSLVGGALLLRQGVNKATLQYRGGVELSVFMQGRCRGWADRRGAPRARGNARGEALHLHRQEGGDGRGTRRSSPTDEDAQTCSPKRRCRRRSASCPLEPELIEVIGQRFVTRPGVYDVVYAKDAIKNLHRDHQSPPGRLLSAWPWCCSSARCC